jgi:hypothetical protein
MLDAFSDSERLPLRRGAMSCGQGKDGNPNQSRSAMRRFLLSAKANKYGWISRSIMSGASGDQCGSVRPSIWLVKYLYTLERKNVACGETQRALQKDKTLWYKCGAAQQMVLLILVFA